MLREAPKDIYIIATNKKRDGLYWKKAIKYGRRGVMIQEFGYPYPVEDEEWLEIRGFPNYLISSWGRVYNYKFDRLLKLRLDTHGYTQVNLSRLGKTINKSIHRLVAEHFVPGWDDGLEVNHIDGDKTYNNERNLEWVTSSMNKQHSYDTGLRIARKIPVKVVETGDIYESILACANAVGLTPGGVKYALRFRTKTRNGLSFRYVD